jgi:hypothetical protein
MVQEALGGVGSVGRAADEGERDRCEFVTLLSRSARLSCAGSRDDTGMDPTRDDTRARDDRLDAVRHRLEDVIGGHPSEADVDVRAYLLDPPPTSEQLQREERRRLIVRRGSMAVAAVVGVLLLAPWPAGPGSVDQRAASSSLAEAVPGAHPDPDVHSAPGPDLSPGTDGDRPAVLPQRIDVPAQPGGDDPATGERSTAPPPKVAPPRPPRPQPPAASRPNPVAPAPASSPPAPAPTRPPARPTPASPTPSTLGGTQGGELIPVL